jgi:hypothetical protein
MFNLPLISSVSRRGQPASRAPKMGLVRVPSRVQMKMRRFLQLERPRVMNSSKSDSEMKVLGYTRISEGQVVGVRVCGRCEETDRACARSPQDVSEMKGFERAGRAARY